MVGLGYALLQSALALWLPFLVTTLAEQPLRNENAQFHTVCFAAAAIHADRPIILRDAQALRQWYGALSAHCQRPLAPPQFDFNSGRLLFGTWNRGEGCWARHELLDFAQDETAKRIRLHLRLVTEGTCPYELLRPLWLSAPAAYHVDLRVDTPE